VIPDISISSRRKVKSVLFASQTPIEQVSTVALDSSSRTSVVLLKILLSEFYGRKSIIYTEQRPEPRTMLRDCDAALLIGHNAIKASLDGLRVYDLAQEWHRFTGLPFVFAFWAAREGVDLAREQDIFYRSREEGLQAFSEISELYSSQLSLSPAEIHSYLKHNLDYSLDESNLAGLSYFYELASKIGDIENPKPPEFLSD
jgi:chorismate dehydratase